MLIDTHILVWAFEGMAGRMGPKTRLLLEQNLSDCLVSMASFIEIRVKQRKGGLKQFSLASLATAIDRGGAQTIGVKLPHIIAMPGREVTPHADPFDLLLMGQAIAEGVPLLTCDSKMLSAHMPGLRLIDGGQ